MSLIFVGRFQPLHLGHLSVIEQYDDLVIGIGSSQYSRTADNPLSAAERRHCLEQFTDAPILEVPDIHNDSAWVEHMLKIVYTVTSQVDGVITGNKLVAELCQAANLEVRPIIRTIDIDATTLRQLIRQANDRWKQYVPVTIQSYVEPIIAETGNSEVKTPNQ